MSCLPAKVDTPWFGGGLRFTCTQCGHCCSGAPGYVWVTTAEIKALAARFEISAAMFERRHVRQVGSRKSLRERRGGDCEFLKRLDDGRAICSVYEGRPKQCTTWPFWDENLESPEAWAAASSDCPGTNNGKHYPLPVIQAALAAP